MTPARIFIFRYAHSVCNDRHHHFCLQHPNSGELLVYGLPIGGDRDLPAQRSQHDLAGHSTLVVHAVYYSDAC